MAEPTNVELAQWLHNGAPETRKAWCELAASQINSHADLVRALEEISRCPLVGFSLNGKETFEQLSSMISGFNSALQARVAIARKALAKVS